MVRNQRDARGVVRRKGDGVQALHSQQQRPDLRQARGDHHAQRHQRGGQHQPTGQAQARQPAPLGEEPADLNHHRHGPQQADDRLAVAQAVKVEREKHVERDVRQDVEEHRRKEPAHHRLPQQRPDSRVIGVVVHRLLVVGQPPHAGHHRRQRGSRPQGEIAHAPLRKPGPSQQHGDQKPHRAPQTDAPVPACVKPHALADHLRHVARDEVEAVEGVQLIVVNLLSLFQFSLFSDSQQVVFEANVPPTNLKPQFVYLSCFWIRDRFE